MNRIKSLREENNFSQNDLAKRIGCAASSIAMYEKEERKPSLEVLIKLSNAFNCSIDYLLGKTDDRHSKAVTDPLDLLNISNKFKDYVPPTQAQKEQIEELLKVILKNNKKGE